MRARWLALGPAWLALLGACYATLVGDPRVWGWWLLVPVVWAAAAGAISLSVYGWQRWRLRTTRKRAILRRV